MEKLKLYQISVYDTTIDTFENFPIEEYEPGVYYKTNNEKILEDIKDIPLATLGFKERESSIEEFRKYHSEEIFIKKEDEPYIQRVLINETRDFRVFMICEVEIEIR